MNLKNILKPLAFLLLIIAANMLFPAFIAWKEHETSSLISFIEAIAINSTIAVIFLISFKKDTNSVMSTREGFLFVASSWFFASLSGALPFYLSGEIPFFHDAYFETMSGFTTTGASILTNIEGLSKSLLFWRSQTHWLGGMGIVVLTVAILPVLGIGALQLVRAEAPGPTVDKITPRITGTAKILWSIYIGMTLVETLLLMAGGMNFFDALTHTFGTLATGGFSTKNGSVGQFQSPFIDWVITIFMVLAGVNFTLHYRLLTGSLKSLVKDNEFVTYIFIFILFSLGVSLSINGEIYGSFAESLQFGSFQVASILTTTGYATADYEKWPALAQTFLFILMFIGGCSGSTGGGIKVIRIVTLFKMGINEMKYLIHPKGVFRLRLNGTIIKKEITYVISAFFFLYITILLLTTFVVATSGTDIPTSFSTALATVGNIGPGFGLIGPADNYAFYPAYVKWFLSLAMIIGRLELYTVLVLFTPTFWKR